MRPSSQQAGMILLMVLLLLSAVSAFIILQLEMLLLHQKMITNWVMQQQKRNEMEALAYTLMEKVSIQQQTPCLIPALQNPNQAVAQLQQQHTCTVQKNNNDYFYLIEDLGFEPCLPAEHNTVLYSTRHWRLTLMSDGETHHYLQLRMARLADIRPCLTQQKRQIMPGLVSWRAWTA